MPFGEQDILAAYVHGDDVVYGDVVTVGIFTRARERPVTDGAGTIVLTAEDSLRFVTRELPTIVRETDITIDGASYRIRELRPLNRLETEAVVVPLS